jgi:hypothetical protein
MTPLAAEAPRSAHVHTDHHPVRVVTLSTVGPPFTCTLQQQARPFGSETYERRHSLERLFAMIDELLRVVDIFDGAVRSQ